MSLRHLVSILTSHRSRFQQSLWTCNNSSHPTQELTTIKENAFVHPQDYKLWMSLLNLKINNCQQTVSQELMIWFKTQLITFQELVTPLPYCLVWLLEASLVLSLCTSSISTRSFHTILNKKFKEFNQSLQKISKNQPLGEFS
jgi:hypothetical protein